jgi:hypothetical protein
MINLVRNTLAAALTLMPLIAFSADVPKIAAGMAEAMQNMTPEQKARMAGAMQRMQQQEAMPKAHTSRSCMTPEKMQKDALFNDKEMAGHCTHTVTENTATSMAVHFTCAENGVTNEGDGRFTATSPTTVKGSMDMHMVMHGKPVSMHSDFQSKWISADCGNEK